ncbi:MAG: hypothetical protein KDA92_04500 [Planctomycetales bacterium]|nr:hypothetical protein [Planctomycetales bacterium]MCA9166432.1 hypothetical protein [Planctomycetales bacterium]
MPVSGWVVTLSDRPASRAAAIRWIDQEPRLERGVISGQRMAVVADTTHAAADRELWSQLESLPGVVMIEVAFIGFEDDDDSDDTAAPTAISLHRPADRLLQTEQTESASHGP